MADDKVELEIKSNTKEVTEDVKELTGNLEEAKDQTKDLGKEGTKGTGLLSKGFKGLGSAMKAAGIGLIVALLAKLGEVFSKNQKVIDTFNAIMESLSIAFQDLFKFLGDNIGTVTGYFKDIFENPKEKLIEFGDAIKANLIERFMSLLEVFGFLSSAVKKLFEGDFAGALEDVKEAGRETVDVFTGVDDSLTKIEETVTNTTKSIVDYVKNTYEAAEANVELRNTAELAEVQIQGLIETFDRQAELQRNIRDDERLTFAERIEANEELGRILDLQQEQMLKLADIRIAAAKIDRDANKGNIEFEKAYQQALNDRAGVEAQITGFRSEQIQNQATLERELLQVQNEIRQEGMSGLQRELEELANSYEQKRKMAIKAGMETTAITEQYERQKSMIVAENTATQLGAYSQLLGGLSALAGENKALSVAQAIIDTYAGANKAFAQGGTAGFVTGAAVIAGGLANVRKILQTDVGTGTGGTVNIESPEELIPATTGAFELGNVQTDAVKAFVVESEITDSQAQMADINRRSTI